MKTIKTAIVALVFLLASVGTVQSQEMKVKKYDNPEWVRVGMIKFKPMMKEKAQSIINNYFVKADMALGKKGPTAFDMATGEYDMIVAFPMDQGIETLNYEMSDSDIAWIKELSKLTGGQEQAMAKLQEFYGMVDKMTSDIARKLN